MIIQEAIKSHKPFRRTAWTAGKKPEYLHTDFSEPLWSLAPHDGYEFYGEDGRQVFLGVRDILAEDWEIKITAHT